MVTDFFDRFNQSEAKTVILEKVINSKFFSMSKVKNFNNWNVFSKHLVNLVKFCQIFGDEFASDYTAL